MWDQTSGAWKQFLYEEQYVHHKTIEFECKLYWQRQIHFALYLTQKI